MKFKPAETLVNVSLLFGEPAMYVSGLNGIGKTEIVKNLTPYFSKKSYYIPNTIEYGGLREKANELISLKIKNIVLADMQTIITRKSSVKTSTLGLIASLISEGYAKDLAFGSTHAITAKPYKLNFVAAGTPSHLIYLIHSQQYDLLNRMVIVPVERKPNEFRKKFQLEIDVARNFDKKIYKEYKMKKFEGVSARHNTMINKLIQELNSIGVDGMEFLSKNAIDLFEAPDGGATNASIAGMMKKVDYSKYEEFPDEDPVSLANPEPEPAKKADIQKAGILGLIEEVNK